MITNKKVKEMLYQKKQLDELRSGEIDYEEASIYTVLLDLVICNELEDVFLMLHNVSHDLGKTKEFDIACSESKDWKWN